MVERKFFDLLFNDIAPSLSHNLCHTFCPSDLEVVGSNPETAKKFTKTMTRKFFFKFKSSFSYYTHSL